MSFLILQFASGIVRPMLATTTRPGSFGKYSQEAVERCENMNQSAKVLDKETLAVIGEVEYINGAYVFVSKEPVP